MTRRMLMSTVALCVHFQRKPVKPPTVIVPKHAVQRCSFAFHSHTTNDANVPYYPRNLHLSRSQINSQLRRRALTWTPNRPTTTGQQRRTTCRLLRVCPSHLRPSQYPFNKSYALRFGQRRAIICLKLRIRPIRIIGRDFGRFFVDVQLGLNLTSTLNASRRMSLSVKRWLKP